MDKAESKSRETGKTAPRESKAEGVIPPKFGGAPGELCSLILYLR
jgi:hypothetical protein